MIKVFGIGLSRTGTSSLNAALEILGYRSIHFPIIMRNTSTVSRLKYRINKWTKELGASTPVFPNFSTASNSSLEFLKPDDAEFDAMTDLSVARFFKELDEAFPGSKFVLTIRDEDRWLNSCAQFFAPDKNMFFKWQQVNVDMYGSAIFDESLYRKSNEKHTKAVLAYFKNRPNDLLVINVPNGEGWEKLCPFLGVSQPTESFPKANVTKP